MNDNVYVLAAGIQMSLITKEVIPEFSGVRQGLDDAVHETGVAEVD